MEDTKKNHIYTRLLAMNVKLDQRMAPDPTYINERIGQCHVCIEEAERFYIEVSMEMSAVERALNTSMADFETKRDTMMSNDPRIQELPSIRDREARSNTLLRKEITEIKSYQRELSDLDKLWKAISLKLKNFNRVNADIKMQLRVMEAQIKLGAPSMDNAAARSLADELGKSTIGADIFSDMQTQADETTVVDPTSPLDVNSLLTNPNEFPVNLSTEINDPLTPDVKELSPSPDVTAESSQDEVLSEDLMDPAWHSSLTHEGDDIQEFLPPSTEEVKVPEEKSVDLDAVFKPSTEPVPTVQVAVVPEPQKEVRREEAQKAVGESLTQKTPEAKNPNEMPIDLESLLSQFTS